jgi:hypothetical protein
MEQNQHWIAIRHSIQSTSVHSYLICTHCCLCETQAGELCVLRLDCGFEYRHDGYKAGMNME